MKYFVQTKKTQTQPQIASIIHETVQYTPVFLHAAIDQTHPVGHKRTFVEHKHDFYHIVLYTKGYGEYSMNGSFYAAQPGTCVLIHPSQQHDFVSRWKQSVYSEITFSYEDTNDQPLCIPFDKLLAIYMGIDISMTANITLSMDQMYVLRNALMVLIDHLGSAHLVSEYHAQYDLARIFNFLIGTAVSMEQKQFPEARLERAKRYIEEHYFERICVDELAKFAGISKGYFFREFKSKFGVSPLAHQQLIRIEAAKTLLKTTVLRCNEVAWRVGFSDVYFFHRVFKKHIGLTPVQYRKTPK